MQRHDYDETETAVENKSVQERDYNDGHRSNRKFSSIIDSLRVKIGKKRLLKTKTLPSTQVTNHESIDSEVHNGAANNRLASENSFTFVPKVPLVRTLTDQPISRRRSLNETSIDEHTFGGSTDKKGEVNQNHETIAAVKNENYNLKETIRQERVSVKSTNSKAPNRSKRQLPKRNSSVSDNNQRLNGRKRSSKVPPTSFQIRDKDFHSIFPDIPSDEQLIIAYPCAWRNEVFMHGRMFLSMNYLCFYACFLKWEEHLSISYKDIIAITREKSAIIIPNAIKIRVTNFDEYLFATYIPRERIFVTLFRLWQNALLDQPLNYQELQTLVYNRQKARDESNEESDESLPLENNKYDQRADRLQQRPTIVNTSTESSSRQTDSSRRTISFKLDNENRTYLKTCPCENHRAKTYADQLFNFDVDTLFELIFGDNEFTRSYQSSQRLSEYNFGEWTVNPDSGWRERPVIYKTNAQTFLGATIVTCREKQVLEIDKPGLIYILNSDVENEGIRYADAFYVSTKFCMIQYDAERSSLKVTAEIRYIKNINSVIKALIGRNINSSIEAGIGELTRRLANRQLTEVNARSSTKRKASYSKRAKLSSDASVPPTVILENSSVNTVVLPEVKLTNQRTSFVFGYKLHDICWFIGLCFLLVHAFLWYKLYSIEEFLLSPETVCSNQCKTCQLMLVD